MTDGRLQVFYDGACPLCSKEMRHYREKDRAGRLEFVDIVQPGFDATAYGLDPQRVQQVMHVRTPDGKVFTEVRAFLQLWKRTPPGIVKTPLRWLLSIPGMVWVAGFFYRAFARNRYKLTGRCTAESCELPTGNDR